MQRTLIVLVALLGCQQAAPQKGGAAKEGSLDAIVEEARVGFEKQAKARQDGNDLAASQIVASTEKHLKRLEGKTVQWSVRVEGVSEKVVGCTAPPVPKLGTVVELRNSAAMPDEATDPGWSLLLRVGKEIDGKTAATLKREGRLTITGKVDSVSTTHYHYPKIVLSGVKAQ